MPVASHLGRVQTPPITEVKRWIRDRAFSADDPLVDLCQAVPSYPPAAELMRHLQQAMGQAETFRYSIDEGLPEVRQELVEWYRRHYRAAPTIDQVCLTVGASQAFWLALTSLCRPGDEVIIQLPAYFDHLMGLQTLGITPVFAPFEPGSGGRPDSRVIDRLITDKTRAILLVTPSNPTGAVIAPDQIDALFALARDRDIALILDETYNAFNSDLPHRLFSAVDWDRHFVHIASFGKTFALTGLRCGALIAAGDLIEQALKVQDSMVVCQSRPAQLALAYGCRHLDAWSAANRAMMQRRHDRFKSEFNAARLDFELVASGSFFAWIKHPWADLSGRQAARRLADRANLICLPGEAFGPGLERYLRLAFGNIEDADIPAAVSRFGRLSG